MSETAKPGRGGERSGAGRKRTHPPNTRTVKIRLTDGEIHLLRQIARGGGVTDGVLALLCRITGSWRRL
jgi:hypothetical protein